MKRKILAVIISIFALIMLVLGVAACDPREGNQGYFDLEYIEKIYINTDGELILVLKDGTEHNYGDIEVGEIFGPNDIKDSYIDHNGNLIIVFANGLELQYGKIRDERGAYLYTEVREGDEVVGYAIRGLLMEASLDLVIPSKFNGLPVVEILDGAFYMNDRIVSVTIPDSVTKIGAWAFEECTSLESVDFGEGIVEIGVSAFCMCSSLTEIVLPDSIEVIGESAFAGCSNVKEITVPMDGVLKTLGDGAFAGCSSIESFIMPDSVTSMGWGAFMQCYSLKLMALSNNLQEVSEYAFSECTSLSTFNFGANSKVGRIGRAAFDRCAIEEIVIPSGVSEIGVSAFNKCPKLTSVTFNESVFTLDDGIFYGCTALESITIPAAVNYIGRSAFEGCENLKRVVFEDFVDWKRAKNEEDPLIAFGPTSLSDAERAADFLVNLYKDYFWKRG